MRTITALRGAGPNGVAVELDGAHWRVLPTEAVVKAGLCVGLGLDRSALRTVRRELRRSEALAAATRALAVREHSTHALTEKLERRGIAPSTRVDAVETLRRSGLLDDTRAATSRARSLAERGYGDAAIAADLDRRGVDAELAADALAALEPESARAAAIAAKRGRGPKTARFLASRGFGEDAVEGARDVDFANDP